MPGAPQTCTPAASRESGPEPASSAWGPATGCAAGAPRWGPDPSSLPEQQGSGPAPAGCCRTACPLGEQGQIAWAPGRRLTAGPGVDSAGLPLRPVPAPARIVPAYLESSVRCQAPSGRWTQLDSCRCSFLPTADARPDAATLRQARGALKEKTEATSTDVDAASRQTRFTAQAGCIPAQAAELCSAPVLPAPPA